MRSLFLLTGFFFWAACACADWTVPVTLSAGEASTQLILGIEAGATDGFDAGKDSPAMPYEEEVVYAYFPHPEWGVIVGNEAVYGYTRDIRGVLPQSFTIEAQSLYLPITVSWSPTSLPERTSLVLNNPLTGDAIDMTEQRDYTFDPGGPSPVSLTIAVAQGDVTPPMAPSGVTLEEKPNALYIYWDRNLESDLMGYKLHYGMESSVYIRTINVRTNTNFSLMNLDPEQLYYVAVTAYDEDLNQSGHSTELSGSYVTGDVTPPEAPTGLTVNSNKKFIQLSWTANAEPDLAGYKLYTGYQPDSWASVQDVGIDPSAKLSGWDKSIVYYFAVSAYDQNDNESALSSVATFPTEPPTEPPTDPPTGGTDPVITNVPDDMVVTTKKSSDTDATVRWRTPKATDAAGNPLPIIVISSPTTGLDSGSRFPLGTTTVTFTATDSSDQNVSASFTVTVTAK